ncbi:MAG: HAMP domain-containing histidine kinase [Lachnospiraceae bacterium]|nr:HAMP domain-containing histidine kinase [Lachnospiraceae bacterium]
MVTKWKNMIKRIGRFLKNHRKLLLGIIFTMLGLFFFCIIIAYRWSHPTEEALFFGVIANVLAGLGIKQILGFYLQKKYADWLPLKEEFYSEWRMQWRKQQIILGVMGIGAGIAACWYFTYMKYSSYWALSNYASGYIMFGTVLIQYGVCQMAVIRFMMGRLNMLMERMARINRESLENALEIEKKSLEKVSRSDQLRVDLITNVSHDLKTPLTSMVGYIELMKKEDLNDITRDYLEVISDKAGKLKEMIESLFSLAKASSGNIELHIESVGLNRLIEQIFADMEDRVKASDLQFVTQLTEEDTDMMTDNMYLYRICQNLIENALKYSAKGTRVFIKTYIEEKEKLCLEITNTAGYFMDFNKEDIVERFARADQARTSEGNGLGLAIVSTYTSALGGEFNLFIDCDQFKAKLVFPKNTKEK